jgi:hypothetical protein
MITNAPWYVTNLTLHDDLKVPCIKDVIQESCLVTCTLKADMVEIENMFVARERL